MKKGGILAVIEFEKVEGPPGPPVGIRVSRDELIAAISPFGFHETVTENIGSSVYITIFSFQPDDDSVDRIKGFYAG